jgi:hypothetical protein
MTTATMEELEQKPEAVTILKRTVCLVLKCERLGNSRKVPLADIKLLLKGTTNGEGGEEEVSADVDELKMTKQLLDKKELAQAANVLTSAQAYLHSVSISGQRIFGAGTYLVPITLVGQVVSRLKTYQAELKTAVDALILRYPEAIEKRRTALGKLFNSADYLSDLEVASEYRLSWRFANFTAPDQLETVDRAVYEEAKRQHEGMLVEAYDDMVLGLRAAALKIVKELAERLKPGPDGKKKAIFPTALRDVREFVAMLPKRNVTDDDELSRAMKEIDAATAGFGVEDLRGSPAVRAAILQAAEKVTAELDGLVMSGRRGVLLGAGPIPSSR